MRNLILVGLLTVVSNWASAQNTCYFILNFTSTNPLQVVQADPVKQWLLWEQKSNIEMFRKSQKPIAVPTALVYKDQVNVTFSSFANADVKNFVLTSSDQIIRWYNHPYNTDKRVPFSQRSSGSIQAYFTASRSLSLVSENSVYTIKTGTNYPHGPKGEYQPEKAKTQEDILDGIERMKYIRNVEQRIGRDPMLMIAKEVAFVSEKKSGDGYLLRDMSFLKDGHYYLPALSIPYAGREIAHLNGEIPEIFWKKHYGETLGRAKAKLLLRYGLQMETPNSQNMLIQLDKNLRPTGVIVFRDVSDTHLIRSLAMALGEDYQYQKDYEMGVENKSMIKPYWSNSSWRMDEAKELSYSPETLKQWGEAHDNAYKQEVEMTTGIDLSNVKDIDWQISSQFADNAGKTRIRNYRLRLLKAHKKAVAQKKSN